MFSIVTAASAQEHDDAHIPIAETPVAETHAATEAHGGEDHGFPPFEPSTYGSQLLWLAITFGFLYWLLSKVALPRLGGILEERDNRIASDLSAAAGLKAETDAAAAAFEQALAEARHRAQAIAQDARNASKAASEAERKRLEAEMAQRMDAAEARISEVKSRALADVDAIARDVAQALVESLLGAGVPSSEVARAVDSAAATRRS